jgi:hypothetical protein
MWYGRGLDEDLSDKAARRSSLILSTIRNRQTVRQQLIVLIHMTLVLAYALGSPAFWLEAKRPEYWFVMYLCRMAL